MRFLDVKKHINLVLSKTINQTLLTFNSGICYAT